MFANAVERLAMQSSIHWLHAHLHQLLIAYFTCKLTASTGMDAWQASGTPDMHSRWTALIPVSTSLSVHFCVVGPCAQVNCCVWHYRDYQAALLRPIQVC